MKPLLIAALPLLALAGPAAAAPAAPALRVETGAVSGVAAGKIERFLGIPYAKPPVGPLRWRAPQPATAWSGVRKAAAYGADCMQEPFPSDAAPLGTKPAEDCLTVNVWRPAGAKPGARLPVMVWIYGGGDVNGGASPAVYSGDAFARDGVIMVSYNWRVGRFGYFAFPELTRQDADKGLFNNYAYLDSIAALKWVQTNIAAFGGDPGKVTIYGQSAGAGQVAMLLVSPMSRGLFSRAIIQSGGGSATERPPFQGGSGLTPEQTGINFARRWGINGTGPEALTELRALSAEHVTDGIHIGTRADQTSTFFGSARDGRILTESFLSAVLAGREARVPLIIGSTTADNYGSVTGKTAEEAITKTFGSAADKARAAYGGLPTTDPQYPIREMARDVSYAAPARYIATKMTAQGLPVFTYRFGYVANAMRKEWAEGPPHATDIPYAMNTVKAKYGADLTATDAKAAATLHAYWVNFAKAGDPNGPGLPRWPAYDPKADELMSFNPDGGAGAVRDPNRARLDAVMEAKGWK